MALIRWGDEEEKDDELYRTPIKTIASVQDGAWQPSPSGADAPALEDKQTPQNENYLLSDEKAQYDEQQRQRDIEIENARRQASARAQAQPPQQADEGSSKKRSPIDKGLDAGKSWERIAEETRMPLEAVRDYSQATRPNYGITPVEKPNQSIFNKVRDVFDANTEADKYRRYQANIQNAGNPEELEPVIMEDPGNIATQAGSHATYLGKGLAIGTDDVQNANESQLALQDQYMKIMVDAREKLKDPSLSEGARKRWAELYLRTANELNYAQQTFSEEVADQIKSTDPAKAATAVGVAGLDVLSGGLAGVAGDQIVRQGVKQGLKSQAKRIAANAALNTGAGAGAGYVDGQDLEGIIKSGLLSGAIGTVADLGLATAGAGLARTAGRGGSRVGNEISGEVVEELDDVVTPVRGQSSTSEIRDGNISFQNRADTPEATPFNSRPDEVTPVADGVSTIPEQKVVDSPIDEVNVDTATATAKVPEVPEASVDEVTPVADGTVRPSEVTPAVGSNTPVIRSEEVRQLQDARAGASQAEEAAINQKLQEINIDTPQIKSSASDVGKTDLTKYSSEEIIADSKRVSDRTAMLKEALDKYPSNPKATPAQGKKIVANRKAYMENVVKEFNAKYGTDFKNYEDMQSRLGHFGESEGDIGTNLLYKQLDQKNGTNNAGNIVPELKSAPQVGKTVPAQVLPENISPVKENSVPEIDAPGDGSLTPAQTAERFMPKLADNSDIKGRIAEAVDMGKDTASPIRDILRDGKVKPKQAERVATQFETLEKQVMDYNRLEEANQRAYSKGGTEALDANVSRERSRTAREMGITTRRLMKEIQRMEGSRDLKIGMVNRLTNVIGTRNANILSSAGLLERNIFQEITANTKLAIKNPIKMAKSTFGEGNILKDTVKSELSHWTDAPRTPIEAVKYVVGNTYRTGMIPTTALANTRRGAVRRELTQWAFKELEGRELSPAEAKKLSGTAGNEMEALVNTFMGVDNGLTNRKMATDALKEWKEYIRTGDDGARTQFLKKVENHNSLADQMIAGLSKEDQGRARGLMAMKNLIFPFVRTATNLAKNTVRQDLNPFAKSLLDEIRVDQRSGGANALNLVKSKLVDYGIMSGVAALASSGMIVYNDGDEIDKPRGWSIKTGDDTYMPVRATSLELPIALAGTAQSMTSDIASGNARDWKYYAGMVATSLPYIDQFNTTTGAVDSAINGEDAGYAAKSYGINTVKSFVPGSNNSIQPYVAGKQGESLNAKTVYDKNLATWLSNTLRKSYDPDFYNSLKDSRDNAGRVRTIDNQGVISNKTINDDSTAEFNDRITDLVNYGREAGLGENTRDMFNTYDTGDNNNFKSIQDSITFLDVEDGGTPDNAKKLEKNGKLNNLAQQMREGFYGDTGSELLTLDGQNLYSDVSVPNKNGTKNSKLPISMQAIKNAIAQTDLPAKDRDAMYEISKKNTELYNQLKAKNINYDQYSAEKAKNEKTYISILNGSKNYKKMLDLFDELDESGFFTADGLGSTKSGQTYLWNSLNALLGSKGATPAANYPKDDKGFTPWGRGGKGSGLRATNKPGDRGNEGIKWTPVSKRQQTAVAAGRYTPLNVKIRLGNEVRKDKTQNFTDRTI